MRSLRVCIDRTRKHVVLDDVYHYLESRGLHANHRTLRDPPVLDKLDDSAQQPGINHHVNAHTSQHVNRNGNGHGHDFSEAFAKISPRESGHVERPGQVMTTPQILLFSGNDELSAKRQVEAYATYYSTLDITDAGDDYVQRLALTLTRRRSQLQWRSFAVVSSGNELQQLAKIASQPQKISSDPGLAFVFTGQGAQWATMGAQMMKFPTFKQSMDRSERILRQLGCEWNLCEEVLRAKDSRINSPEVAQPACTALQIGLLHVLESLHIHPKAVIGHSSGEIAAAYSVGALSQASALQVAFHRGVCSKLLADSPLIPTGMLAVSLSKEMIEPYIDRVEPRTAPRDLVVACVNSPRNVTVSGSAARLDALGQLLKDSDVVARRLVVSVAYHSHHMQAVVDQYSSSLHDLETGTSPNQPIAFFSSLKARRVPPSELSKKAYWLSNLVHPVDFLGGMKALLAASTSRLRKKLDLSHRTRFCVSMLLEIGPHSALQRPLKEILIASATSQQLEYSSLLVRGQDADKTFLTAVGQIASNGYFLDVSTANNLNLQPLAKLPMLSDLPSYVFNHSKSYWYESRLSNRYRKQSQGKLDLLGKPALDWSPLEPTWRNFLRVSEMPWMEDHVIHDSIIYPGAGMLVVAIEAANQLANGANDAIGIELRDVSFIKSLMISTDSIGSEIRFSIQTHQSRIDSKPLKDWASFRLCAYEKDGWEECCHGQIRVQYQLSSNDVDETPEEVVLCEELKTCRSLVAGVCESELDPHTFYEGLHKSGFGLGKAFQRASEASFSNDQKVTGVIQLYQWREEDYRQDHVIHPTSLDALFHLAMAGRSSGGHRAIPTMVPSFIRSLKLCRTGLSHPHNSEIHETAWVKSEDGRAVTFAAFALNDTDDKVLVEFDDLVLTKIGDSRENLQTQELQVHQMVHTVIRKADLALIPSAPGSLVRDLPEIDSAVLRHWMDLQGHKTPDFRALQVGDACGNLVCQILEDLTTRDHDSKVISTRYGAWDFANDVSSKLEELRDTFRGYPFTSFKPLDGRSDLAAQFETLPAYDVILVTAPTASDDTQVNGLLRLLRPGGWLIRNLTATQSHEPELFDIICPSKAESNERSGPVTRTLYPSSRGPHCSAVGLILDMASEWQKDAAEAVARHLRSFGFQNVALMSMEDVPSQILEDDIYVVLLELNRPYLYELSEEEYVALKRFILSTTNLLWVNVGGSEAPAPEQAMIHGLARSLRNERPDLRMSVLSLENHGNLREHQLDHLAAILLTNHVPRSCTGDVEFFEISSILHIPRVYPALHTTTEIMSRSQIHTRHSTQVKAVPPLKMTIGSPGLLNTLHFVPDVAANQDLEADEVEVRVEATGVNFKDVLVALGQLPFATMGQECAGVVERAGPLAGFEKGERVILIGAETFRTHARGRSSNVFRVPENVAIDVAAAIPAQFTTAYAVLHRLSRLEQGESVLIHAAAGGTGQALLQLAKRVGATIFATVSSREKKDLLCRAYGVPRPHIFYSRDTTFSNGIKRLTCGRGVDVVINSLVGEAVHASLECMAPCGRFVEIGKKDILSNSSLPMYAFQKGLSFMAFDGPTWFQQKPTQARCDVEQVLGLFARDKLHAPQPFRVLDIADAEKAFRLLQEGKSPGKTVLSVQESSVVQVCPI